MNSTPKCAGCPYVRLSGVARATGNNSHLGDPQSEFMCDHPEAVSNFNRICPRSPKMAGFIGYSEPGRFVPAIKTSPRWCPLRDHKGVQ